MNQATASFPGLPAAVQARLPRLVETGCVLLAAWLVAGWMVTDDRHFANESSGQAIAAMQRPDTASIAAYPLFGKMAALPVAQAKPQPVSAAPVARLNIRLLGTVVAGDRSYAVMRLGVGGEKVVRLGDTIQPGVTLSEVAADAIVVDNRGRREKVLMAKGSMGTGATEFHASPAAAPAMPNPLASAVPASIEQHSFTRVEIQDELNDLPGLLTGALAVPHQTNGNPDGFMLQDIVPGSLYDKAGLKDGDVIRMVNGQMVNTPEQGIALFQALQTSNSLNLEITRAGAAQQLHFDIR